MTEPADIFISYNRQDREIAEQFEQALSAEGFSVWWDATLRSGDAYDEVTEAALRGAKAVIVLWSKRSVVSRWVRAEATVADRNKTMVPVMIEPCERPIMFELTQTAELGHWQGDRNDRAWRAFVGDVRRFIAAQEATSASAEESADEEAATPVSSPKAPVLGETGEAPSLAVMPFTNRSHVPGDEVFAVGLVEDLIDALSQSVNVRVVSRSATARFKTDAVVDLAAMARELCVRYVMEGNLRRSGDVLRVAAQLVEAASGEILWTQKFERPLSQLAELEEELVLDVAANLDTQVYRAEMTRVLRKPANLTAWEACTRAVAAYRQVGIENLVQALAEATRAVEIAPDYGLAHAMLADAQSTVFMWSKPEDQPPLREIKAHIDRALVLEPDNAMVLAHVAEALNYIGMAEQALEPAQRALQLSPGFALAHYAYAVACFYLDRCEEGLGHLDAELRVAPGGHTLFASETWRGAIHARAGNWEKAVQAYRRATQLNASTAPGWLGLGFAAQLAGKEEEAGQAMAKVVQLVPDSDIDHWELLMERWFGSSRHRAILLEAMRAAWPRNTALHNASG